MDQPFIGVIFAHAGTYPPASWALCSGQTQSISQNEALYTLIGTTFGGDGQSTFNLPDLRGRMPIGQGQGPGLSNYVIGQVSGQENITLNSNQLPAHTHQVNVGTAAGTVAVPTSTSYLAGSGSISFYATGTPNATLASGSTGISGGSQAISVVQPVLATNYIISLFGIFPARN